ncbi:MAG: hypothetical protein KIS66_03125 [Fimbriimonadaceae bacterium]|nr:hypothetical protein [Fimbriimonadaceae bacterium]
MSNWRALCFLAVSAMTLGSLAIGQDLGKGRTNRTGGSSGQERGAPPRNDPPRRDDTSRTGGGSSGQERGAPPRNDPPRRDDTSRTGGGGSGQERGGFPRTDPPRRDDTTRTGGGGSGQERGGFPRTDPPRRDDTTRTGGGGSGQERGGFPRTDPPRRDDTTGRTGGSVGDLGRSSGNDRSTGDTAGRTRGGGGGYDERGRPQTGGLGRGDTTRAGGDPGSQTNRTRGGGVGSYDERGRPGATTGAPNDLSRAVGRRGNGSGAYGTNNNVGRDATSHTRVGNIDIFSGPLDSQVRREDRIRIITGGRRGYSHYNRDWCDDWFAFPFYAFDPYRYRCVIGPWYCYPHLPAYLVVSRVMYIEVPVISYGYPYRWNRVDTGWGADRYSELDYSVDDLVRGFERRDMNLVARLVPNDGRINYYFDGRYEYSIRADDFYGLLSDLVEGTLTQEYRVLDVRRDGRFATIFAEHVYQDTWGARRSSYHMFRLEDVRGRYEIRDFGTSNNRWRY